MKASEVYNDNIKQTEEQHRNVHLISILFILQLKESFYSTLDIVPNGIVMIDMKTKEPTYANQEIDTILFEENEP